jgi:hypothetical protein
MTFGHTTIIIMASVQTPAVLMAFVLAKFVLLTFI